MFRFVFARLAVNGIINMYVLWGVFVSVYETKILSYIFNNTVILNSIGLIVALGRERGLVTTSLYPQYMTAFQITLLEIPL